MTPERLLVHARAILTDRFGCEPSEALSKWPDALPYVAVQVATDDVPLSVKHAIWDRLLKPAWENLNHSVVRCNAGRQPTSLWWASMWKPLWFVRVDGPRLTIFVCTEPNPAKQLEALTKAEAEAA